MKKWTVKVLIVMLTALIGTGAYLFNHYGSLLTDTPMTETVVAEIEASNAQFTETLETYIGKASAQSITAQINTGEPVTAPVATAVTGEKVHPTQNAQVKKDPPQVKTGSESGTSPEAAQTKTPVQSENPAEIEKELIRQSLIELLQIKNDFSRQLQALIEQARADYNGLSPEERTAESKVRLGLKYMDQVIVLESQADAAIYGIINGLEASLKTNHFSTEIVETIQRYYEDQKELQRTYYMSKLKS